LSLVPFAKVEAVGNDFVLVLDGAVPRRDEARFAEWACARRFAVGADGLLVLGSREGGLVLRMYNADGSEDFCGNGLRCAAWYAHVHGMAGAEATILHGGQEVPARIVDEEVRVALRPASFDPRDVPVDSPGPWIEREAEGVMGTAVSTGSAHFVAFVPELPEDGMFVEASRRLEFSPLFPERISVMWARQEAPGSFRLRIWERGVGETLGCGTGSLAVASAAWRLFDAPKTVEVLSPGGAVRVEEDSGRVWIASRARIVYSGALDWPTSA
jgi:diaminopimelate epimerase